MIVASLDLSSAFDLKDTNLLIKHLKMVGFLYDVIKLSKDWLKTDPSTSALIGKTLHYLDQFYLNLV
jgi:hypothetical protein